MTWKPENYQKLEAWLTHPDTPEDAWLTWTWKQIAEASGMSLGAVNEYLPNVIAEQKNIMPSKVLEQRNEYGYSVGRKMATAPLPKSYTDKIDALLKDDPDILPMDIAYLVKLPILTVSRYLNKVKEHTNGTAKEIG